MVKFYLGAVLFALQGTFGGLGVLSGRHERRRRSGKSFFRSKIVVFMVIFLIVVASIVAYKLIYGGGTGMSVGATRVLLVTSMGNITIELYDDMPITAANFKNLTGMGIYDGTIFHRVSHDFVIQGGDPSGTGLGDPRIASIPDELPNKHSNVRGAVAMAKMSAPDSAARPNSATSQFFVDLKDNSVSLDSSYSVFGQVVAGMNVADDIGALPLVGGVEDGRPEQNVTLIKAQLIG